VTAATYPEGKSMGREGMLLNVICVLWYLWRWR
jgi:hypothetical protein